MGKGFEKMLGRFVVTEFKWIKSTLQKCPDLLTKCYPETKKDFFDRLNVSGGKNIDEECAKLLVEIKEICGIPTKQNK